MAVVSVDPDLAPNELRHALYGGDLVVLTRLAAVEDLVEYTRAELCRLFAPHDPRHAHRFFDPEQVAHMLGSWKPRFIHAERSKQLTTAVVREAGLAVEHTYYDLPKPRTAFPAGHLTAGMAFAFPWHRDVWYSAPRQQINWWLPVYDVRPDNAMGFDLASFDRAVANTSGAFDYYRNNVQRSSTVTAVTTERQVRPGAVDHRPAQEVVVLPRPGEVLLFSGAQLHRSIPNTSELSRYSVDFRTVDARDLAQDRGAPTLDVACTGTAIRDFHSVADGSGFDEGTVTAWFGAPPADAVLVFEPAT